MYTKSQYKIYVSYFGMHLFATEEIQDKSKAIFIFNELRKNLKEEDGYLLIIKKFKYTSEAIDI